jgi:hypothetical protein
VKKIIPSNEADQYLCPMAVPTPQRNDFGNRCQGNRCMKWEDETEKKEVESLETITENGITRLVTHTRTKDLPTGKGWCGL